MKAATALKVQRVGVIVEMLCMLGMMSIGWPNVRKSDLVFGVPMYRVFWVGLGCGLVIWCIGKASYRRTRQRGEE